MSFIPRHLDKGIQMNEYQLLYKQFIIKSQLLYTKHKKNCFTLSIRMGAFQIAKHKTVSDNKPLFHFQIESNSYFQKQHTN